MQCFGSENTEIIFSDKSFVNSTCPILLYSYYPIPPEGEWDLVFVWFHLRYYYYTRSSSSSSSKGWSDFTLLLKLSQ